MKLLFKIIVHVLSKLLHVTGCMNGFYQDLHVDCGENKNQKKIANKMFKVFAK